MAVTNRKKKPQSVGSQPSVTILCVDDEASILDSLRRFFSSFGWNTLCATSGSEGFRLLEKAEQEGQEINIVISDMRMPEMSGSEFLTCVKQRYPDIIRILLTGFSDVDALSEAINRASIFNYVAKPWDETLLHQLILSALRTQISEKEKRRLQDLTAAQCIELKQLNEELEQRVFERTTALQSTLEKLKRSHHFLQKNNHDTIKLLAHIVDWQEHKFGTDSSAITEMANHIARKLKLPKTDIKTLLEACLLHDIGMLAIPESIRSKAVGDLNNQELKVYKKHTILGEAALSSVTSLQNAAMLVRSHHEYLDGSGFPDHKSEQQLTSIERILTAVIDYHELSQGLTNETVQNSEEALVFLHKHAGKKYDSSVIQMIDDYVTQKTDSPLNETKKDALKLKKGMRLAKSITSETGIRLLVRGTELNQKHIDRLVRFEQDTGTKLNIRVVSESTKSHETDII